MMEFDSKTIADAVRTIYDPLSSAELRRNAHLFLESVQETCKTQSSCFRLAEIGFDLVENSEYSSEIRHCGLHFIEFCVIFGWYNLSQDQKQLIKTGCFDRLAQKSDDVFLLSNAGRDGLARIVAEMAKREWPQQWVTFLVEIEQLINARPQQTQIALLVLLRLIEDVCVLQNVENSTRRKEMHNALIVVAPDVLRICIAVLVRYDPQSSIGSVEHNQPTSSHAQICRTALRLLSSYMEWIPAKDLITYKSELLPRLCRFLNYSPPDLAVNLKIESADCLVQLVSRKHTNKSELLPALDLFETPEMTAILEAARNAADNCTDEMEYAFLKTISSIFAGLGQTLCLLWGTSSGIKTEPPNFELYLNAQLAFFRHPSMTLRLQSVGTLITFCRHESIRECKAFVDLLPDFLRSITSNCRRIGLPSRDEMERPYSYYSSLDFEDDAEFLINFNRFREQVWSFVRVSISIDYSMAYDVGRAWLNDVLLRVSTIGSNVAPDSNLESELDSMNRYLSNLFGAMSKSEVFQNEKIQKDGSDMLALIISKLESIQLPWLLNCLLSTCSALFPFLVKHEPLYVVAIIRIIFRWARIPNDGQQQQSDDPLKALRHHAMHEFVRLCVDYTDQMLPFIDDLLPELFEWSRDLSPRQKCSLAEGLAALSNKFRDYGRQSTFLAEILRDCAAYWTSSIVTESVSNVEQFMRFIGLSSQAPSMFTDETPESNQRREIVNACVMVNSVLNRSCVPIDQEALETGGFHETHNGRSVVKHPAYEIFQPMFVNVFSLARCLNGIYSSAGIANVHPSFGGIKVLDLPDAEKFSVHAATWSSVTLGRTDSDKMFQKTSIIDYMKGFVADLTEQVHLLIGLIASKFQWQFFAHPQASNFLLHGPLGHVEEILDQRLRYIVRRCFQSVVDYVHDYPEYYPTIVACLAKLLNATHARLCSRWDAVIGRRESIDDSIVGGRDLTSQEIYLEDSTCLLTREAVLLIQRIMTAVQGKPNGGASQPTDDEENGNDDSIEDVQMENGFGGGHHGGGGGKLAMGKEMSQLGEYLCEPANGCVISMTLTSFHTLAWPDTKAAVKAIPFCEMIAEKLTSNGFLDEEASVHLFSRTLAAIQLHGQHDNAASPLLTLACQLYERWFQRFPKVRELIMSIPECKEDALKDFEGKLIGSRPSRSMPEKMKKDLFKKLIRSIIGTNIGQQFKRSAQLRDLPALWIPPRQKSQPIINADLGICALFATGDA